MKGNLECQGLIVAWIASIVYIVRRGKVQARSWRTVNTWPLLFSDSVGNYQCWQTQWMNVNIHIVIKLFRQVFTFSLEIILLSNKTWKQSNYPCFIPKKFRFVQNLSITSIEYMSMHTCSSAELNVGRPLRWWLAHAPFLNCSHPIVTYPVLSYLIFTYKMCQYN